MGVRIMRTFVTCLAVLALSIAGVGNSWGEEVKGLPKKGDIWSPEDEQITCDTDQQIKDIADAGKKIADEKGLGPMGRKFAAYRAQKNDRGNAVCLKYPIVEARVEDEPGHIGTRFNYEGDEIEVYLVHVRLQEFPHEIYPVLFGVLLRAAPQIKPEPKAL